MFLVLYWSVGKLASEPIVYGVPQRLGADTEESENDSTPASAE